MPLSDKTRKILWAKSGNLCAICHRKLVVDETELDSDSVVGEECHICAQSAGGPRFDPAYPNEKIDSLENLILLCATDHKKVDDQNATHTAEWLHEKRVAHEKWVEAS
jgi:5-methylcytosine-specific restriction endonuclease McrA